MGNLYGKIVMTDTFLTRRQVSVEVTIFKEAGQVSVEAPIVSDTLNTFFTSEIITAESLREISKIPDTILTACIFVESH